MAVKIIYGTSPNVRSNACLNAMSASQGHYSRIFYIVPETLSYDAETKVCGKFDVSCPLTAEVISFKRLYHSVITEYGDFGYKKISDSAKALLFSYICKKNLNNFKVLRKAASHAGIGETLNTVIQELKTYNVSNTELKNLCENSELPEKLKAKLHDIEIIYSEYSKHIDGSFSDAQDEMDILASIINTHPEYFKDSLVVADGFEMFTPKETVVLSTIMRSCKDMLFAFNCDSEEIYSEYDTFITVKKCIRNTKKLALDFGLQISQSEKINDESFYKDIPDIKHLLDETANHSENKYSGQAENISISVFNKETDETEFIADEIMRLVRDNNVRFREITVIARSADIYNSIIKRKFEDYNIPAFVDTKSDALSQPAIYSLFCALNCVTTGFSQNSIISYIKSGFTNLTSVEAGNLENYILSTGICKKSFTSGKYFTYLPYMSKGLDEKEFLDDINSIITKAAQPLIKLADELEKASDFKSKCNALYDFALEISLFEKIESTILRVGKNTLQTAAYYSQVWNTFVNTLDEISEVLGNAKCTSAEFCEMLSVALSIHKISVIPTLKDCVTVSSDTRVACSKYVFVVGMCDGVYPSVSSDEGIINDSDRQFLKKAGVTLAPDTNEKAMDENLVLFNVLNLCEKKLYISYPVSDMSGASKFPAAVINSSVKIFGKEIICDRIGETGNSGLDSITSPVPTFERFAKKLRSYADGEELNSEWKQVGDWFSKNERWRSKTEFCEDMLVPDDEKLFVSPDVYPQSINMSVSRLETYQKCPFSYFAQYVLGLQQRKDTEILNADAGSIVHFVLDSLSKTITEKFGSWDDVTDEFIEAEVSRLVSYSIEETEKQYDEHLASRLWQLSRLKSKLTVSVVQIARHLRSGKFVPLGYEISFGDGCGKFEAYQTDTNGKTIKLRGKIDRADIFVDENGTKFIKIIDYKSSTHDFDLSMFKNGLQLQLAVYLDRVCEAEKALPGGMLYFKIHDPVISSENLSDINDNDEIYSLIEGDFKMSGIILDDQTVINAMDSDAANYESNILPMKISKRTEEKKGVMSLEQFETLKSELKKIISSISSQMTSGDVSVRPVYYKNKSTVKMIGCSFCPYMDTCHFDSRCGSKFNFVSDSKNLKKDGEHDA